MMKVLMGLGAAALAAFATVFALAFAGGPAATAASVRTLHRSAAEISGPCDEAEHAADPRCTGAAVTRRQKAHEAGENERADDRGHHRGHDDDSGNDHRSGSNSGRG